MTIFWVAGESSGDRHAARLISALGERRPGWRHCGMGGEAMREAGAELDADLSEAAVMGLTEVVKQLPRLIALRNRLVDLIAERGADLVVLVDFPEFNLTLARRLRKKLGRRVPILYYVSPQVWAWRRGRIRSIAERVDAMAVLFPFEVDVYEPHGLETVFFGHPLVGDVAPSASPEEIRRRWGIPDDHACVALLPGSRSHEIERHLPVQLEAVRRLRDRVSEPVSVLLARANTVSRDLLAQLAAGTPGLVIVDDSRDALAASRVGLVKSGTSTVEALLLGTPFAVMYKVSPMTFRIAKALVKGVDHIAMVNVLAGRELVPERVQDDATPGALAADLERLWAGPDRERVQRELADLAGTLGEPGATGRLADWVVDRFGKGLVPCGESGVVAISNHWD